MRSRGIAINVLIMEHAKVAKPHPTVLVIKQDDAVGSDLEVALTRAGVDVRSLSSGVAARDFTDHRNTFRPDLVILDVDLRASGDGYALLTLLRQLDLRLLLLADTLDDRRVAVRAGAHESLVKPFSMEDVLRRTRALLRLTDVAETARCIGDLVLDEAAHTVARRGNVIDLTRIEFELLSVLARHPQQVLSKGQLLAQVWGFGHHDANLVEVHVCSLRKKLEPHGSRMIHTVRSAGYVLRP